MHPLPHRVFFYQFMNKNTALMANTMDLPDATEASNQDAPNDVKEEL